jgi:membrane protein
LIVALGFLLLVSLIITAALGALYDYLSARLPITPIVLEVLNNVITLLVIFGLFSMIYKILPDVELSWRDVRTGALVTTVLFVIGKFLIGLYLGRGSIGSTYGAAGSLAIIFVWVYYSAQILFLGAEFTYVYSSRLGSGVRPSAHAVKTVGTIEKKK